MSICHSLVHSLSWLTLLLSWCFSFYSYSFCISSNFGLFSPSSDPIPAFGFMSDVPPFIPQFDCIFQAFFCHQLESKPSYFQCFWMPLALLSDFIIYSLYIPKCVKASQLWRGICGDRKSETDSQFFEKSCFCCEQWGCTKKKLNSQFQLW